MSLLLVVSLVVAVPLWFLMFYVFADLPHTRKKEQQALLTASSVRQDGVWPPAPTTHREPPEPVPCAWCLICHRGSTMDAVSDNGGHCVYAGCPACVCDMVAWHDLRTHIAELPELPEPGVVYADLIRVKAETPEAASPDA